jgi:hypothetical protein
MAERIESRLSGFHCCYALVGKEGVMPTLRERTVRTRGVFRRLPKASLVTHLIIVTDQDRSRGQAAGTCLPPCWIAA